MVKAGLATAALAGNASSGDRGVVLEFAGGAVVALIDGLGHGDMASKAASAAAAALGEDPAQPVDELVRRCHAQLRHTRGAVMTVASFERGAMTWVGVGNVDGILVRPDRVEAINTRGGIVGYQLPALSPRRLDVAPGDTLVLTTDGVRHGFRAAIDQREPQVIADAILADFGKATDDACVVVARYVGDAA
ncbi:MAG: SpoIIE family protein phosphatase [Deltaproteobacteria bacterium]|nr:SpoIIE family protein phosphatase [Deltaproteobacteria bacterium]